METGEPKYEKVLFRYFSSVMDEEVTETIQSLVVDESEGIYKLDGIPFYGPIVAVGDEFFAEYDETEKCITYRETVNPSGNSVLLVILLDEDPDILKRLRKEMTNFGCNSEHVSDGYIAVSLPFDVNYAPIQKRLQRLEDDEVLSYAEPCLSDKHAEEAESE